MNSSSNSEGRFRRLEGIISENQAPFCVHGSRMLHGTFGHSKELPDIQGLEQDYAQVADYGSQIPIH